MKKLPLCTLLGGAAFAIAGTVSLLQLAPRPDPFPLFFPLMWDLIMVAIGAGLILRCDCARRAGIAWSVFCIIASLAIGTAAFGWLLPQHGEPLGTQRMIFMFVSVAFGLVFGVWQIFALNSPAVREWTEPHRPEKHAHHHG
jgi:tryptophan-rich sensory protein